MTLADNPFLRLAERYEAEHEAVANPESLREELEQDWRLWVPTLLPAHASYGFAAHHEDFWNWLWHVERHGRPQPFIGIWARGGAKSTSAEAGCVALGARRKRRYALYVSETQEQADKHVESIGSMLESPEVAAHYPSMSERLVGKYGNSRGWRRNRLRTASGFTVDALGLDSASRGARVEEQRPDLIVLDDLDDPLDTPAAVDKKIEILTKGVLPLGTPNLAVVAIQNLIHDLSVFARLAGIGGAKADFLADRIVSGPIPAVEGLEWQERDGQFVITAGIPTWEGQDLIACQSMIQTYGLSAFLSECQHETEPPAGGMFDHLVYKRIPWSDIPPLVRTVVWVDPAVTDKDTSDSQGIQADALGANGKVYRLFSWEQRTSPQDAIRRALRKAVELRATTLGVETDQGGDTWFSVVAEAKRALWEEEQLDCSTVHFRQDKAGAGHGPKAHRASLMLAQGYEQGKIVHVEGTHVVLERALRRFPKLKPLDLVDCAYWAWRDLTGGLSSSTYVDKRAAAR